MSETLSRDECLAHAERIGITLRAFRRRIKNYGLEKAIRMPRQSKSSAGRLGKIKSEWKHNLVLPGSGPKR